VSEVYYQRLVDIVLNHKEYLQFHGGDSHDRSIHKIDIPIQVYSSDNTQFSEGARIQSNIEINTPKIAGRTDSFRSMSSVDEALFRKEYCKDVLKNNSDKLSQEKYKTNSPKKNVSFFTGSNERMNDDTISGSIPLNTYNGNIIGGQAIEQKGDKVENNDQQNTHHVLDNIIRIDINPVKELIEDLSSPNNPGSFTPNSNSDNDFSNRRE